MSCQFLDQLSSAFSYLKPVSVNKIHYLIVPGRVFQQFLVEDKRNHVENYQLILSHSYKETLPELHSIFRRSHAVSFGCARAPWQKREVDKQSAEGINRQLMQTGASGHSMIHERNTDYERNIMHRNQHNSCFIEQTIILTGAFHHKEPERAIVHMPPNLRAQ